ncbi:serine/threonine protein kinase [Pseudanabaena yagii]|uniref:non-specific serine/threonine protein kinase n=1 Tax=Pseudanabaena yagii GIHE-NHR1 TaxID=2722753 RepID=A0ABX1LU89_9CYAN|nr:serine/threonine-protein kinase [Pseudanabaena yagii]NMF59720.1 serine/threonine protein kinase [Pseudanabaena yagii GIHE-NHR1]
MKLIHNIGDIVNEYRITKFLGQGGIAATYLAENIQVNQTVAIKAITLKKVENFKMIELFEREAKVLAQLSHVSIPKYISYFQIDRPRQRIFYIVQQLAKGENLANLIENGWNPNELEVKQIAVRFLEILIYLQQIIPPVIHRDIKPQNVIYNRDLDFQDKEKIFLVDFGAVQDTYHNSLTGGSTIVGTYGYMAPEQFRGQAKLSTDLYGLGATLIFLLTHQHPSELPQKKLKIDWRSQVKEGKLGKHFETWLDRMIEPAIEERFRSAEEALAILRGEKTYTSYNNQRKARPATSKIVIKEISNKLVISIPQIFLRSNYSYFFLSIPIIWNVFLFFYLWIVFQTIDFASIINGISLGGLAFLAVFVFINIWIIFLFLIACVSKIYIEIDATSILFRREIFGWMVQNTRVIGKIGKILQVNLKNTLLSIRRGSPIMVCNLTIKRRNIRFASFLSEEEKQWLIEEIQDFVERQKLKLEEE